MYLRFIAFGDGGWGAIDFHRICISQQYRLYSIIVSILRYIRDEERYKRII